MGYRYYDTKEMPVAFPFGYGLSYTTFAYSNLKLDKDELTEKDTLTVSVDVTNTGNVPGKEIVQLYVRDNSGACRRPDKELKGYEKVALEPGETKTVTMTLDHRSFAWYNTDMKDWYSASGTYDILIGASSRDIRLTSAVQMKSSVKPPLKLHLNTTLGELLSDERTMEYGKYLADKMTSFFGGSSDEASEAITDEMNAAMATSMPIRNVFSFGACSKEEVLEGLNKLIEAQK